MADKYLDNIVLALLANGSNGSRRIVDDRRHLLVPYGGASSPVLSTAQFAPLSGNASSLYFPVAANRCASPHHPDFDLEDRPFTIELWVRPAVVNTLQVLIEKKFSSTTFPAFGISITATGAVYAVAYTSTSFTITSTQLLSADTWYHIAFVRTKALGFALYIDGALAGSSAGNSSPLTVNTAELSIGARGTTASPSLGFTGYLDHVVITKNICRYDAAFTRPTTPYAVRHAASVAGLVTDSDSNPQRRIVRAYERVRGRLLGEAVSGTDGVYAITNIPGTECTVVRIDGEVDPYYNKTALLLHCDGAAGDTELVDEVGHLCLTTLAGTGGISTSTYAPLTGNAASLGVGTRMTRIPMSDDLLLADDDFTIECWARRTDQLYVFGQSSWTAPSMTWRCFVASSGYVQFSYRTDGSSAGGDLLFGGTVPSDIWFHLALVREGNVLTCYVDGAVFGSAQAISGEIWATIDPLYACYGTAGGFIDEVRLTIGAARYTGPFTRPSAPFGFISAPTENALVFDNVVPAE